MTQISKILLVSLGTCSLALGVVGMFLPVLPTTPFLLLAAFFYARSSDRLLQWLLANRWCGAYIRNYRDGRGIPRRQKLFLLYALWLTIGATILFGDPVRWVEWLLLAVAVGVTVHILRLKTLTRDELQASVTGSGVFG